MLPSAAGYHFAILTIICTLAIFFFPLVSGPYPVTHGPAADFETVQAFQLIRLAIALLALATLTLVAHYFALITSRSIAFPRRFSRFFPAIKLPVLRC